MFLAHFHHWNVPKCPPRSYQPCLQYRHHGIQGWTRWRKGYLLRRGWLALLKLLICRSCMSFTYNIPIVKENSRHTNSISKISFEFWGLQHACAISSKLSSILVLAIYFYVCVQGGSVRDMTNTFQASNFLRGADGCDAFCEDLRSIGVLKWRYPNMQSVTMTID